MKTEDFDYSLPDALIAQTPLAARQDSRLLVVGEQSSDLQDTQFSKFDQYCEPGDLLVLNNTRVVPARLHCHKPTGANVEVMLETQLSDKEFLALVKANKPLRPGQVLQIGQTDILKFVEREGMFFRFQILPSVYQHGYDLFHQFGNIPLPPYIKRPVDKEDIARYQTVYAHCEGAVAAPTAGLHFSDELLARLSDKGVEQAALTLHVGAGTFQPVKVDEITQHTMHKEWISVSEETVHKIEQTKAAGKKVIAVGTTSVRALESAAMGGQLCPYEGTTDIFIYPGFEFKVVDALLTNFHLPKSTLLMMISAFGGTALIQSAYAHAIAERYRFFSYGDAMMLFPKTQKSRRAGKQNPK